MRILFGVATVLFLSLWAFCAPTTIWLQPSTLAQTLPPSPTPSWQMTTTATNIATFIVDYAGATVKEAYFLQDPACATPLTATRLITNARTAISNTVTGQRMAVTLSASGQIAESVGWPQDLFSWSVYLGDFSAQALLAPCSGQVIFAGESIWMGHGVRPTLHTLIAPAALLHLPTAIPLPPTLTTLASAGLITDTVVAAWSTIADLNLVHDLAHQPFKVVALLYRPAMGYLDPTQELAQAEWILIVYTEPTPRAQTQLEHYLPLIRQ